MQTVQLNIGRVTQKKPASEALESFSLDSAQQVNKKMGVMFLMNYSK